MNVEQVVPEWKRLYDDYAIKRLSLSGTYKPIVGFNNACVNSDGMEVGILHRANYYTIEKDGDVIGMKFIGAWEDNIKLYLI